MLKTLIIKNFVLIELLELNPSREFNIITGETGAGKSIMLGAIGLLLGNRADTKTLYNQDQKCIIEAFFEIEGYNMESLFAESDIDYDPLCVIRREINPGGKSRVFVNDTPVNLENLRKIGGRLMDIHSQHETLLLGNANFQISIVDAYAGNEKLLQSHKEYYKQHLNIKQQYDLLIKESEEAKRQEDYNRFLLKEFLDVQLKADEQEGLENELKLLENSEEIKTRLHQVVQRLSLSEECVLTNLQGIEKQTSFLTQFGPDYSSLHERLRACFLELKDLSYEFEKEEEGVESGADKIEEVRERLSEIYTLQKKHGVNSVQELLTIQDQLEEKVKFVHDMEEKIQSMKRSLDVSNEKLKKSSDAITSSRKEVMKKVQTELEKLLKEVGIPNAQIEIKHTSVPIGINGGDQVSILFSANKGVPPQDLKNVASGGEFSRLMLCIKYLLADKTYMPTIIFDEIDTGISGEVAIKVGKMMKEMAKNHQVIAISHLPQMAAQGNAHFFVYKDNSKEKTTSKVRKLSEEERIFEIAQMIGGAKPSEVALTNAKELLALN